MRFSAVSAPAAIFGTAILLATVAEACPGSTILVPRQFALTGADLTQPQSFRTTAGGSSDVAACGLPGVGFATDMANLSLDLSNMAPYALSLSVESECDATLLVSTADYQWLFDDDSNGDLDPRMTIREAAHLDGRVDIWVGSYDERACAAMLRVQAVPSDGTVPPPSITPPNVTPPTVTPPAHQDTPVLPPSQGSQDRIRIHSATYGRNCGAQEGNVIPHIVQQCNGQAVCDYRIDYTVIGDPVRGCAKDYEVSYHCGDGVLRSAYAAPEAGFGSVVRLQCAPSEEIRNPIRVRSGTYGGNCGAPWGNETEHLTEHCDGQQSCTYIVDYTVIGDPAYGCAKDYVAEYYCNDGQIRTARAEPEAGYQRPVTLECPLQ